MTHGRLQIRPAAKAEIPTLVEIVTAVDDPRVLLGPGVGAVSAPKLLWRRFAAPVGDLGYRNCWVAEFGGQLAGFVICVPLDHIDGLIGKVLPEAVAAARYGVDLGTVLNINLIGVAAPFRRQGLASQLFGWTVEHARERGYRFVMGQAWERNPASLACLRRFGFEPIYDALFPYPDGGKERFHFLDYDCRAAAEDS